MKRMILAGLLALVAGVPCLMAQPKPKSEAERAALQALFSATTPDATIQAAEDLLNKYSKTDYKDIALFKEAGAYLTKGDNINAQIFAQRALDANPNNFQASLMLGDIITKSTRETDLDRDTKLAKADKYLNQAIDTLKAAAKPNPQLSDQEWDQFKKQFTSQAEDDLGLNQMTRKDFAAAATEFKQAADTNPEPAYQVHLAMALQDSGKNDEALAICDKLLADPQLHPRIAQVAREIKASATKAKGAPKP